jgi:long-chain acyl-CoA synthetase
MLLNDFLTQSAITHPEKVALVAGDTRLSFAELDNRSDRLARYLVASGIKRRDRICIMAENRPEAVLAIFAVLKAGGCFVMLHPSTKAKRLSYILNHCEARALVVESSRLAKAEEALSTSPSVSCLVVAGGDAHPVSTRVTVASFDEALAHAIDTQPLPRVIDVDLAALIYTSGSTGEPKGITLTHHNMVAAATSITQYIGNTGDGVIINALPLSFDYGLYQVIMGFRTGARVILERSFLYPYAVIQRMAAEGVTGLPGVPTMFALLLQFKTLEQFDLSSLRYITNTGAPLPPEHIRRLQEIFPGVKIFSMYGLTECKRVSYLDPDEIGRRPRSVGKAMPNLETMIVDEDGTPVKPGQVGQLIVRGASIMQGYWRADQDAEQVIRQGDYPEDRWLYTGDLFYQDGEGYLYFVGRADDMIKSRGQRVSPKEIEDVLYELDGVVEAAVVGVDDQILGKAIVACVVPHRNTQLTQEQVRIHCAQRLEDFKIPQQVRVFDRLPVTSTGKISRREIVELLDRDTGRPVGTTASYVEATS